MITALRKKIKGTGVKFILLFTLIAMAVIPLVFELFKSRMGVPAIVSVNGYDITQKEFRYQVEHETEHINMLKQQFGPQVDVYLRARGLHDPQYIALQKLIQNTLLDVLARKTGLESSSDIILEKIHDPYFVVNELAKVIPLALIEQDGTINPRALEYYLQYKGMTFADFEKQIEEAIQRSSMLQLAGLAAYVSQDQLKEYYKTHFLDKKYEVLTLPLEQYINKVKQQDLSNNAIKDFFEKENKKSKRYWLPEKRSVAVWEFSPENYNIAINDKSVDTYYNKHKRKEFMLEPTKVQIRTIYLKVDDPAQMTASFKKAQDIKSQLDKNPDTFASLAKKHSDDKASAEKGGLLEFFSRGEQDPAVEKIAFRLKEDGDISDIIQVENGFYIIQREKKQMATYKPLSEVKNTIKKTLLKNRFNNRFKSDMRRMIPQIKKNGTILDSLISKKEAKKQQVTVAQKEATPLAQEAFKLKKNGWGYFVSNDKGYLVQVVGIEKAKAPSLESVKQKVKNDLYQDRARTLQKKDFEKVQSMIKEKASLDGIAKELGIAYKKTDWIDRQNEEAIRSLQKQGLPIEKMLQMEYIGTIDSVMNGDKAFIIRVSDSKSFNNNDFEQKKTEMQARLYQDQMDEMKHSLVASLYRNAKIEVSEMIKSTKAHWTL